MYDVVEYVRGVIKRFHFCRRRHACAPYVSVCRVIFIPHGIVVVFVVFIELFSFRFSFESFLYSLPCFVCVVCEYNVMDMDSDFVEFVQASVDEESHGACFVFVCVVHECGIHASIDVDDISSLHVFCSVDDACYPVGEPYGLSCHPRGVEFLHCGVHKFFIDDCPP